MQAADRFPTRRCICALRRYSPLITSETLAEFAAYHSGGNNAVTVLTAIFDNPSVTAIIRGEDGNLQKS